MSSSHRKHGMSFMEWTSMRLETEILDRFLVVNLRDILCFLNFCFCALSSLLFGYENKSSHGHIMVETWSMGKG